MNHKGDKKALDEIKTVSVVPTRIRTYLAVNVAIAVMMAIVLTVWSEIRTGRYQLINIILIGFYTIVLGSLCLGPILIVEIYLYRKKKGTWYAFNHSTGRRYRDLAMEQRERLFWKSEAYRARLSLGVAPKADANRRRLFAAASEADSVSRAALLIKVATNFEQAGKREAARRCYLQIMKRFADSSEAREAACRLAPTDHAMTQGER